MKINEGKSWGDLSHEAKELVLFADNHKELNDKVLKPILKNLARKKIRGKYDKDLANQAFTYLADASAKEYTSQNGAKGDDWHKKFTPTHRKDAAKHWEEFHRDNLDDSLREEIEVEERAMEPYYAIMNSIMEGKPADFKNLFLETLHDKLLERVEALKEEVSKTMWNPKVDEEVVATGIHGLLHNAANRK